MEKPAATQPLHIPEQIDRELLQDAMEGMAHGVAVWDKDLNLMLYSRKFLEMWGISEEFVTQHPNLKQILRHTLQSMGVGEEELDQVMAERFKNYENALAEGTPTYIHLPNGRWLENTFRELESGRKVFTYTDITARRKAEEELERRATIDFLTDLPNRGHFLELAEAALAAAERKGDMIYVAMLDIDHFKIVNDTHGHGVGDQVLREIAALIKRLIRIYDIAGRIGGEEFALIAPDVNREQAALLFERLRLEIEALSYEGVEGLRVTASIGIAESQPGQSIDQTLNLADEALYHAKQTGRNRVVFRSDFD